MENQFENIAREFVEAMNEQISDMDVDFDGMGFPGGCGIFGAVTKNGIVANVVHMDEDGLHIGSPIFGKPERKKLSTQLSDLFFNYNHPNINDFHNPQAENSFDTLKEAAKMDAMTFHETYEGLIKELEDVSATDIAYDYVNRV